MSFQATIASIKLAGFGFDEPGGDRPIENYGGDPLYCHVSAIGSTGQFSIAIDQSGPSSFASGSGPVRLITLAYVRTGAPSQLMTFNPVESSPIYNGQPVDMALHFEDLTRGQLVITQTPAADSAGTAASAAQSRAAAPDAADGSSDGTPTIGLVVLSPTVTKTHTIAFFTNVPVDTDDFADHTIATISWPGSGSSLGPMGVVTIP
jgi:hypothetical protein